jgi:hypothetical protein
MSLATLDTIVIAPALMSVLFITDCRVSGSFRPARPGRSGRISSGRGSEMIRRGRSFDR